MRAPISTSPLVGSSCAEHDLEQGRFAEAVASDNSEPLARLQGLSETIPEQAAAAQFHPDIAQFDHAIGQLRRGRDDQIHIELRFRRFLRGHFEIALHPID